MGLLPSRPVSEREALFMSAGIQRFSAAVGMPSPSNVWQMAVHAFKAYELYLLDRLELAVEATRMALRHSSGGSWLPNILYLASAELEARDFAERIERPPLIFEVPAGHPEAAAVVDLTESYAARLESIFGVPRRPTMFTLLPPDSLADFSHSPYGYFVPKKEYGKVCVPRESEDDARDMARVLTHEYTHAIIARATDDRAPRWFTEGLAQWAELELTDEPAPEYLALMPEEHPSFGQLDELFGADIPLPDDRMQYAYAGALSAVEHLIERHSLPAVLEYMNHLAVDSQRRAFRRAFRQSPWGFQRWWHRRLREAANTAPDV